MDLQLCEIMLPSYWQLSDCKQEQNISKLIMLAAHKSAEVTNNYIAYYLLFIILLLKGQNMYMYEHVFYI